MLHTAQSKRLGAPLVRAVLENSTSGRLRVDGKFFSAHGARRRIQGVTYGPFALNTNGAPFPELDVIRTDFDAMQSIGINAIRTYHLPPDDMLELADETGMGVVVDVPWSKHLCFLDSQQSQREAREAVRQAGKRGRRYSQLWAYSIANEIPPDVVRWHGPRKIQKFLSELVDEMHQVDPESLVTYANFPPTEFLDLSFLDFVTFNVYLHDPETFRRYLLRLQNLAADKPLVLGELGMDTIREGELAQADFLASHLGESRVIGLAGAFVFSWTDEWHTGGHTVQDWAFGITQPDRSPKPSFHAIREIYQQPLVSHLNSVPRVSIVICTYNGGSTLRQCLESVFHLDYPEFEIIVVDDGSTDDTQEILRDFPRVHNVRQANLGLSAARNTGLQVATGSIVAYTDSDCFVDRDWLTYLVAQLERSTAAAVGGPNYTPQDGSLAACVAAAPGQPTHVLESDQVAEHIPGCNMAFRKEALCAISGFDNQFRKAGDDVDICWRLQQAGYWITFAPSAFVWHHRRQTPRAYLKQQFGYGEAEALLRFKHPTRFNSSGQWTWQGVIYGGAFRGLVVSQPIIYHGTFASGLFQCIYQPSPAHWLMFPTTLEWHFLTAMTLLLGVIVPSVWWLTGAMLASAILLAALEALQAKLQPQHDRWLNRLIVAGLCYAQPLWRSWARYRTRYYHRASALESLEDGEFQLNVFRQIGPLRFWGNHSPERTELLQRLIDYLAGRRCGTTVDSGWSNWDLEVFSDPWALVRVRTVQEEHGNGQKSIYVSCRWSYSRLSRVILLLDCLAVLISLPAGIGTTCGAAAVTAAFACFGARRASRLTRRLAKAVRGVAGSMNLVYCPDVASPAVDSNGSVPAVVGQES